MGRFFAILLRVAITIILVGGAFGYMIYLIKTKPEPRSRPASREYPVVEIMELQPETFKVELPSQGIVRPRTQTDLTAEVSGKIAKISDAFLEGAIFEKGTVLVELDSRDYETALTRSEAELIRAETAVSVKEAETEAARKNWQRLGTGKPSDLALKIPQLREAEANLTAAEANVVEAKLNLERCKIVAPYPGRVQSKEADVGQFVNPGSMLGKIFSTEVFEVRLPLRDDQLEFVNLTPEDLKDMPEVVLQAENGTDTQWVAWIERSAAAVDERSRQLFVIAAVDTSRKDGPPLPSGTYVDAKISGRLLENVFVIPRAALRSSDTVLAISPMNKVKLRPLDIVYDGDENLIIARADGAIEPGTKIALTPMPFVSQNDFVTIKGEQSNFPEVPEPQEKGKGKGKGKGGKGKAKE